MGNIGRAPETRLSDNGTLIATFSMASNAVRNTPEGQVKKTDWYRVTAFGRQAETLARYVQKGSRLFVQGRLSFNPWLDRNGGAQVSADVVLQDFQFVSDGRRDESGGDGTDMADPSIPVAADVQEFTGQPAVQ
jgi:single-strand DNA-binding protein